MLLAEEKDKRIIKKIYEKVVIENSQKTLRKLLTYNLKGDKILYADMEVASIKAYF